MRGDSVVEERQQDEWWVHWRSSRSVCGSARPPGRLARRLVARPGRRVRAVDQDERRAHRQLATEKFWRAEFDLEAADLALEFHTCEQLLQIQLSSPTPPPPALVGGALDRASKMNVCTPNPVLAASRVVEHSLAEVAEK